jgi:succinyl-CoA synthetase beta subunit
VDEPSTGCCITAATPWATNHRLVTSTLDVVAQAGGAKANLLDAGGASKARAITSAVELILPDPK